MQQVKCEDDVFASRLTRFRSSRLEFDGAVLGCLVFWEHLLVVYLNLFVKILLLSRAATERYWIVQKRREFFSKFLFIAFDVWKKNVFGD